MKIDLEVNVKFPQLDHIVGPGILPLVRAVLGLTQAVIKLDQTVTTTGAAIMRTVEELSTNLDDTNELLGQIITKLVTNDEREAALRAEIARLIQEANIAQSAKDALQAKIDAATEKSEAVENRAREALAGVPPVGGTALLPTYGTRAEFDTAAAAYGGPEAVNLDGSQVKDGTLPALEYYSHSADNSVSTTGPTD